MSRFVIAVTAGNLPRECLLTGGKERSIERNLNNTRNAAFWVEIAASGFALLAMTNKKVLAMTNPLVSAPLLKILE